MTASKIFLYFCLSFTGGIFFSSFFGTSQVLIIIFLILGIFLISVPPSLNTGKRPGLVVLGFFILFLVLGIWRHQNIELRIRNDELRILNDENEIITLTGLVSEEPKMGENNQKLTLTISSEKASREGRVLVMTRKYPEYQYGDKLKIMGKLESPSENIEGFNYKDYLKKDGIYSVINYPQIEIIGKGLGNPLKRLALSFKAQLKNSIDKFISPPESGLLEALLFGDEEKISQEWKEKFNLTGTRHITAVSGMNITIISILILNFILFLGFWRRQAILISFLLIFFYILMVGAPASALRAGIMGSLFLLAQYFGRSSSGSRAIFFAAALMLFLNPLLLKLDIGFQLSFLAMMGLIYLQPVFLNFLRKVPNFFQLRYTLAATLSAQIFTFPILIFNFGQISLIGVLANVLIVPLLAFITIAGFIFSFLGMIFQPLGQIIALPAWLFLTYIIKTVDLFSQIPFTGLNFKISWFWLMLLYLFLTIFVRWLNRKFLQPDFLKN